MLAVIRFFTVLFGVVLVSVVSEEVEESSTNSDAKSVWYPPFDHHSHPGGRHRNPFGAPQFGYGPGRIHRGGVGSGFRGGVGGGFRGGVGGGFAGGVVSGGVVSGGFAAGFLDPTGLAALPGYPPSFGAWSVAGIGYGFNPVATGLTWLSGVSFYAYTICEVSMASVWFKEVEPSSDLARRAEIRRMTRSLVPRGQHHIKCMNQQGLTTAFHVEGCLQAASRMAEEKLSEAREEECSLKLKASGYQAKAHGITVTEMRRATYRLLEQCATATKAAKANGQVLNSHSRRSPTSDVHLKGSQHSVAVLLDH